MDQQRPLSVREALKMALENNKDIEVARENVKMAEFDLLGSRGAYDPRLSTQSYYERINTPSSSFLSGGANGAVTQADYTGTLRLEGLAPKGGGTYRLDFSSVRSTTNNAFTALNPLYPTALTFNFTQPLVRRLRFDNPRRQIEIAKESFVDGRTVSPASDRNNHQRAARLLGSGVRLAQFADPARRVAGRAFAAGT